MPLAYFPDLKCNPSCRRRPVSMPHAPTATGTCRDDRSGGNRACLMLLAGLFLLAGCTEAPESDRSLEPVAIEAGDECHVCGMLITRFPGPKGEAFLRHREQALKFCSTRDLFAWLLQPETAASVQAVYVHDMGRAAWDAPGLEHLIPAETAWYVVGSDRRGAMGPTLASFAERADAEAFAAEHGGRVLAYEAVDLAVLEAMSGAEPSHPGQ